MLALIRVSLPVRFGWRRIRCRQVPIKWAAKVRGNVITIDDERGLKNHLGRVVRGSVEETLNALLDAEADRLCNAQRFERTEARGDTRAGHYECKLQT